MPSMPGSPTAAVSSKVRVNWSYLLLRGESLFRSHFVLSLKQKLFRKAHLNLLKSHLRRRLKASMVRALIWKKETFCAALILQYQVPRLALKRKMLLVGI